MFGKNSKCSKHQANLKSNQSDFKKSTTAIVQQELNDPICPRELRPLVPKNDDNNGNDLKILSMYQTNAMEDESSKENYLHPHTLKKTQFDIEEERVAKIAASYLHDYEHARKSTLYPDSDHISSFQLHLYEFRCSFVWQCGLILGSVALFGASHFEGNRLNPSQSRNPTVLIILVAFSIIVYGLDLIMLNIILRPSKIAHYEVKKRLNNPLKVSRKEHWTIPLVLFFIYLIIDTWQYLRYCSRNEDISIMWSGILKPIIFFYYSNRARDAFKALHAVLPMVLQVILLELFLIFIFATMACQIYGNEFPSIFGDLPMSFVSMFELSTTVVNPSLWMEVYVKYKPSAIFFVVFLILNVFYMHSLVLSVVFQSYAQKIANIRRKRTIYREDALRNSFQTLQKLNRYRSGEEQSMVPSDAISTKSLHKTLQYVRRHYATEKIKVLTKLVDWKWIGYIEFDTFRTRIPNVMNQSLTSRRSPSLYSTIIDTFAIVVAATNLVYVVYFSNTKNFSIMQESIVRWGKIITLFSIVDLWMRLNPLRFLPDIKFDNAFDTLACIAAFVSLYGLKQSDERVDYLLVGRSIDLFRCLRFFSLIRDIIRRSAKVLPVFVGPLILVASALHIFCCVGMRLWGGLIHVGTIEGISSFYDYNNFNSYLSGLMTMFQVLVVNDWNQVAKVYLSVDRAEVVYTFFIFGNIVGVSILWNIFLSFFIGAFIAPTLKTEDDDDGNSQSFLGTMTTSVHRGTYNSSSALTSNASIRSLIKSVSLNEDRNNNQVVSFPIVQTPAESVLEAEQLNLSQRQNFDNIMQTAIGDSDEMAEEERIFRFYNLLELMEKMTAGGMEKVGFLVCSTKTMHRHGNQRFQFMMNQFMSHEKMHLTVSQMSEEVQFFASRTTSLNTVSFEDEDNPHMERVFESSDGSGDILKVKASLFDEEYNLVLFVAMTEVNSITLRNNIKK